MEGNNESLSKATSTTSHAKGHKVIRVTSAMLCKKGKSYFFLHSISFYCGIKLIALLVVLNKKLPTGVELTL